MAQRRLHPVDPAKVWATSVALLRRECALDPWAPRVVLAASRTVARLLIREVGRGGDGAVNLQPLTLHDLAREMAEPHSDRRPLPKWADRALVAHFLSSHPGPLGDRALRPAVVAAVASSLRDLREAGLVRLDAASGDARLGHIAQLLEWFSRTLDERKLADDAALYADALGRPAPRGATRLHVHGIYDLTGVQQRLLQDLAARFEFDWVLPTPAPDSPASAIVEETRAFLASSGFAVGDAPASEPAPPPETEILACAGVRAEVQEIVRSVLAAAEQGIAFGEMAVALARPEALAPRLLEQFDRARIPVAERPPERLTDRPQGRALLALAELLGGPPSRAGAIAVIKERLAAALTPPLAALAVDRLARRAGLGRPDATTWRAQLEAAARGLEHEARRREDAAGDVTEREPDEAIASPSAARLRAEAESARRLARVAGDMLEAVEGFRARAQRARSFAEIAELLVRLVEGVLKESPAAAAGRETAQVLAGFDRVGASVNFALALDTWRTSLTQRDDVEDAAAALTQPAADAAPVAGRKAGEGVLLIDFNRARGLETRAAWLVGLAESNFPGAPRLDAYLDDALRRRVAEITGAALRPRARRLLETDLIFALGRALGRERVVCSWPRQDETTGAIQLPAEPLARWIEERSGQPLDPKDPANAPGVTRVSADAPAPDDPRRPLLDVAEYDLATAGRGAAGDHLDDDADFRRRRRAHANRWRRFRFTEHDGIVGAVAPAMFSVTGLEQLAICPFRYFLRHVLDLSPVPDLDPLASPSPLDVGTAAHRALGDVFGKIAGQPPPDPDGAAALALEAARRFADHVRALQRDGAGGASGLWRAEIERVGRDLMQFVVQEIEDLRAKNRQVESLELRRRGRMETDRGAVEISGQPDRVDRGASGGLSVTDYKCSTGRDFPGKGEKLFEGGARLQLPLYAWLLMNDADAPAQVDEVRYAFLKAEAPRREFAAERETLEKRGAELRELVAQLAGVARDGDFFAVPDDGENCRYCDFRFLCGPGKVALEQRKLRDDRRQRFDQLAKDFP